LSQYLGKKQHGYWWLHTNGTILYSNNYHSMQAHPFFSMWTCVKYWKVRCELDWYRMNKEYKELAEGVVLMVA